MGAAGGTGGTPPPGELVLVSSVHWAQWQDGLAAIRGDLWFKFFDLYFE